MDDHLLHFYGLARDPFAPVSDVTELLATPSQSELVSQILAAVGTEPGVVTVRGHKGVGKTSIGRLVGLTLQRHGVLAIELVAGQHNALEIQAKIAQAAGIGGTAQLTPDQLARELPDRLGRKGLVLVMDDAHRLSELEYRYLVLLRAALGFTKVGFGLILIGAAGRWLATETPDLPGLRLETVARQVIFPLREEEAVELLQHKFRRAGRPMTQVLSAAAALAVARGAEGVPGDVAALATTALSTAYARRRRRATLRTVLPLLSADGGQAMPLIVHALRGPALVAAGLLVAALVGGGIIWRDELGLSEAPRRLAGVYAALGNLVDPPPEDASPPEVLDPGVAAPSPVAAPPPEPPPAPPSPGLAAAAPPAPAPASPAEPQPAEPPAANPPPAALAQVEPMPPPVAAPVDQPPTPAMDLPAIAATPLPDLPDAAPSSTVPTVPPAAPPVLASAEPPHPPEPPAPAPSAEPAPSPELPASPGPQPGATAHAGIVETPLPPPPAPQRLASAEPASAPPPPAFDLPAIAEAPLPAPTPAPVASPRSPAVLTSQPAAPTPAKPPPAEVASIPPGPPSQPTPPVSRPAAPLPEKAAREAPHGSPGLILVAGADDTLPKLYARVYRGITPPPYADVLAINHSPIRPGELLIFPEPPNGWLKH